MHWNKARTYKLILLCVYKLLMRYTHIAFIFNIKNNTNNQQNSLIQTLYFFHCGAAQDFITPYVCLCFFCTFRVGVIQYFSRLFFHRFTINRVFFFNYVFISFMFFFVLCNVIETFFGSSGSLHVFNQLILALLQAGTCAF